MDSAKGTDAKNASIGQLPPNQGKIIYKLNLTEDLAIIRMAPTDGSFISDFKAGQFVTLGVKLPEENKIVYRAYSISSAPEEKRYYEFYIKWALEPIPGKITSVIFHLNEGNTILWRKPAGTFTIEDKKPDGTEESRRLVPVSIRNRPRSLYKLYLAFEKERNKQENNFTSWGKIILLNLGIGTCCKTLQIKVMIPIAIHGISSILQLLADLIINYPKVGRDEQEESKHCS